MLTTRTFLFVFLSICCFAAPLFPLSPQIDSAVSLLVAQDYAGASHRLESILSKRPEDFDALYMSLATRQTRILDYESYTIEGQRYYAYADSILTTLTRRLPALRGHDSLRCLFYIGNIHGGKSIMLAKNEKWITAISMAYSSVKILDEVIERDADFHAAYLGTGVFDFYLSKSLKWLPTFGNKESQGIKKIRVATRAPFPYNLVAKNSLCWIMMEQGKLAMADSIAETVTRVMPMNTIFLRIRALIAMYRKNWVQARVLSSKLIELSSDRKPVNWSDMTCGYRILVNAYDGLGEKEKAISEARKAFGLAIPKKYKEIPYIREHLGNIEAIVTPYGHPAR